MRKTLLLTLALFLATATFAQSRRIILRETFDSTSMPEGWSTSDNSSENWIISESNNADCDANELKLNPTPQTVGFVRAITKPVDLTGLNKVVVSFKHYFAKKSIGGTIGVATSSNNGTTWSSAWTKTYSEEGLYSIAEEISTPDMGKNNVVFCIYYQGNTNNIGGWYFDNVEISITEDIDAKAESINIPGFIPAGNTDIVFSVQNAGMNDITSFEATYNINGISVTETFQANIAQFETQQFIFSEKAYLIPDSYELSIEIGSVNGCDDQNTTNNSMRKNLSVALGGTQRIPMIEHFSSATCASCMPLNGVMKELTDNNPGKYTYTKYAMNFPSYGDDYYTAEGGARKNYYNVSAVPHICFNGGNHEYVAVSQEELDESYNSPAFVNIKGAFDIEGTNINIKIDVMTYIELENKRLFVTVNEKTTVENVEPINGSDSEFHHIMMKMITGTQGETINMTEGSSKHFEYSYDMSQTFIEDINDLEVAVWVQDYQTREIYNSHFMYEYTDHPYPAQNLMLNKETDSYILTWDAPEQGTPRGYNIYVNGDLVMENTNEMSYAINNADNYCSAEAVALYDNGKESVGIIAVHGLSMTEQEELNISIYPNPAKDFVKLSAISYQLSAVRVYNCLGMLVEEIEMNSNEIEINTSGYNAGIYFINIQTEDGNVTKKVIIE